MTLYHERVGTVELLRPDGKLDVHSAPTLLEKVENLVTAGRVRIVLDMSHVKFISSYGLGSLVTSSKLLENHGGSLKLSCLTQEVKVSLEITGLMAGFAVFSTAEDAIADFSK